MKRLTIITLLAFLCLNGHAQKTDSISADRYNYRNVLELAKFHELRYLKLRDYVDSILPEIFDQLPNLEYLELNSSHIKQIPKSIGKLSKLKTLIICNGYSPILIPSEIGNLTQLTKLQLYNHEFSVVPYEIGNLVNLEELMLCGDLTDLPASVANWKKLKKLYVEGNKFRKIPSPIFQLKQLEYLDLGRNDLTEISDSIRALKNLNELGLEGNIELSQFPTHFCELEKLEKLYIQNTKIILLPRCLNELKSLKQIRMCSTIIDDPEAVESVFGQKIDWDWSCRGLERNLVDFNDIYGTYNLSFKNKKDTLILNYGYFYNEPRSIDEEYSRIITIRIVNKDSLEFGKVYSATNPLFRITTLHSSVWDWEDAQRVHDIQGYLYFKKSSKKEYRVYLNLDLIENGEKRKLVDKFLTFK